MFRSGTIRHTYPFCWALLDAASVLRPQTWYIRTTQFRERFSALNETINWYPDHIKNGRFGNWLANNVDWALGRERYWGTPLPVWECPECHNQEMAGSVQELSQKAGKDLTGLDLHRPYVDEIHWTCSKCLQGRNDARSRADRRVV